MQKIYYRIYRFCGNRSDHFRYGGLWTDGRYFIQAAQQLEGTTVTLFKMGEPEVPTVHEFLKDKLTEGMCLGFDGRCVSAAETEELKSLLADKNIRFSVEED